jgi:hypothetical protein
VCYRSPNSVKHHRGVGIGRVRALRGPARGYEPAYCWFPDHVTVCHRHRRWIGPSARTWDDQVSLAAHPEVITAARQHQRLRGPHGPDIVDTALNDALRIVLRQRRIAGLVEYDVVNAGGAPRWSTGRHVRTHVATHPQVVGLATAIVTFRPQLLQRQQPKSCHRSLSRPVCYRIRRRE